MTKAKKHEPTQKPWERQTWDTNAGYNYFHKYYLPQPIPRSLDVAYRAYLAERDGVFTVNDSWVLPDKYKGKRASGSWRNWAHAVKGKGSRPKKIPGALTWSERAGAFDDFLKRQTEALWLAREMESRESDWAVSLELRQAGRGILAEHDKFIRTSSRLIPGDIKAKINDREVITLKLNTADGIKMLELASKLGRAAANVEQQPQRIIAEIDKEVDFILAIIEQMTDETTYNAILTAIQAGGVSSQETAETTQT